MGGNAVNQISALAPAWICGNCGAGLDDACNSLGPNCRIDSERVIFALERAGATLLAMRTTSPLPAPYRCALPAVLRDVYDTWDWKEPASAVDNRPAVPSAAAVTAMDRTFQWLAFIPPRTVRRIVAIRSLVHPLTGRHCVHWRALGKLLHCSHEAARGWHGGGVRMILDHLTITKT